MFVLIATVAAGCEKEECEAVIDSYIEVQADGTGKYYIVTVSNKYEVSKEMQYKHQKGDTYCH